MKYLVYCLKGKVSYSIGVFDTYLEAHKFVEEFTQRYDVLLMIKGVNERNMKYYLYAVVERKDGQVFRQRVKQVDNPLDPDEAIKALKNYHKMLGEYYVILDWYIDA